jgi:hypothetical protein
VSFVESLQKLFGRNPAMAQVLVILTRSLGLAVGPLLTEDKEESKPEAHFIGEEYWNGGLLCELHYVANREQRTVGKGTTQVMAKADLQTKMQTRRKASGAQ